MIELYLSGKPKPKPAGTLKYVNGRATISMDKDGYHKYCSSIVKSILEQCSLSEIQPYGFVYHFVVPNLQRLGDVTNCAEAIQDCLVKAKIIKNDNPKIVNKVFISLHLGKDYFTTVYLCDKIEFIDVIQRIIQ